MCTNLGSVCHTCIVKEFGFFVASATFHVRRRELTRSWGLHRWTRWLFLTSTFSSDRVTLQKSESRLPASSIQRVASSLSGQMTKPTGFCASGVESSGSVAPNYWFMCEFMDLLVPLRLSRSDLLDSLPCISASWLRSLFQDGREELSKTHARDFFARE